VPGIDHGERHEITVKSTAKTTTKRIDRKATTWPPSK